MYAVRAVRYAMAEHSGSVPCRRTVITSKRDGPFYRWMESRQYLGEKRSSMNLIILTTILRSSHLPYSAIQWLLARGLRFRFLVLFTDKSNQCPTPSGDYRFARAILISFAIVLTSMCLSQYLRMRVAAMQGPPMRPLRFADAT